MASPHRGLDGAGQGDDEAGGDGATVALHHGQPWDGEGGGSTVTRYDYDVQDHLTSVTDAEGNATVYTYSDRDLLTRQVSPVSGTSSFAYNEHGELVSETDGRGITTLRTVDALDRMSFLDTPENALDTTWVYDDPGVPFSRGRLTAITRNGESVDYAYDRFGRVTRDGALAFAYDQNGNRTAITYPGGVTATYGHDFADREETLTVQDGTTTTGLVTGAAYLPFGPLTSLVLGNGVTETRTFDRRYFPTGITAGTLLDWTYTTDGVGNILSIADAGPGEDRTYGYQDVHYFLTAGVGPWGSLAWTYDKIGNRLTEARDGATSSYSYVPSATGGRNPKLAQVTDSAGEVTRYFFDAAGNQTYRSREATKERYSYDAAGRMSQIRRDAPDSVGTRASFFYDGRSFLSEASLTPFPGRPAKVTTRPTYSSDGLLMHKSSNEALEADDPREGAVAQTTSSVFYFAGRPVGILESETLTDLAGGTTESAELLYLIADHLGTPVLATSDAGTSSWSGGFEPFGADYSGAGEAKIFLRLPGQWEGGRWGEAALGADLYYNVYRWYGHGTGRYTKSDPIGLRAGPNLFAYVEANPVGFYDLTGLTCRSNWQFFWDWALERGAANRYYGPGSFQTDELRNAAPGTFMRNVFRSKGCRNLRLESYGTIRAYAQTVYAPCSTGFQFGGFLWSATNIPEGKVVYRIYNQASLYSLLLHIPGIPHKPRGGKFPFGGNIDQNVYWVEDSPCGLCIDN